jgi:hypothetical protein
VTTFFFGVSKINNLPLKYPNNCGSWVSDLLDRHDLKPQVDLSLDRLEPQ